ncbi:MAG: DUF4236 domain-containing protein [Candidatus Binatia bacterium]|nr:DUF4236 domain-containing protein [Candidatus Binatia bacterium]
MGFRFWRRVQILPGVSVNLSKSGASLSFGPRGAKFTIGPGGQRATVGIPGTGIFYTTTFPTKKTSRGGNAQVSEPALPAVRPEDRLTLGFFARLWTPKEEEAFVDGCRALVQGETAQALAMLDQAPQLADAAFFAGVLAFERGDWDKAKRHLTFALEHEKELGTLFAKYGVALTVSVRIAPEICAHVGPNLQGLLLALAELYQHTGQWVDASLCLERLRSLAPDDLVVRLSLAELLLDARPNDRESLQEVVQLAAGVENDTPLHTALLLYKARALRRLGLLAAALETLSTALRKTAGRDPELLRALRYERALVYEGLGDVRRARNDLEKLYAEVPNYEDVAARLGLV